VALRTFAWLNLWHAGLACGATPTSQSITTRAWIGRLICFSLSSFAFARFPLLRGQLYHHGHGHGHTYMEWTTGATHGFYNTFHLSSRIFYHRIVRGRENHEGLCARSLKECCRQSSQAAPAPIATLGSHCSGYCIGHLMACTIIGEGRKGDGIASHFVC
jgi:hypothetical protein